MWWSEMKNEKKFIMFLQKQDYIKSAYLFGSAAKGRTGKLSDVDIGILLDESLVKEDLLNLKLNLISEIISILGTDKIDLTVMNHAPLLLKYNIIKHGKILKSCEPERINFESNILSEYLDKQYFIKRHTENTIKRIAKVGLA